MVKQYETVFIATPVLSDAQMKEAVAKYVNLIKNNGGEIVYEEDWGLRTLAYPIQHKTSGFYYLIQFQAKPEFLFTLETQYKRDEQILRFLTVALDKHAVEYAEKRRANRAAKAAASAQEPAKAEKAAPAPAEEAAPAAGNAPATATEPAAEAAQTSNE